MEFQALPSHPNLEYKMAGLFQTTHWGFHMTAIANEIISIFKCRSFRLMRHCPRDNISNVFFFRGGAVEIMVTSENRVSMDCSFRLVISALSVV